MKKSFLSTSLAIAALGFSISVFAESKIEEGKYNIDPMHSKVSFEIPHLVISSVEGSFKQFGGVIDLNKDFAKSKADVAVEIASIDTGVKDRDDHLKSPDFFDQAKHAQMTFKSKKISGKAEDFKLTGDLTIKGVTKSVTFEGKFLGNVTDGYGNRKAAFKATTKINRKDFGLTWGKMVEAGPVVGDEVEIKLNVQAAKEVKK